MTLTDSHLHLWDTQRLQYPWLHSLPQLQGTFLTEQYRQATAGYNVTQMIFVQAECLPGQNMAEVAFVTEQAKLDPRITGMVAYAPLEAGKTSLLPFAGNAFVKGVRRMYDDAPGTCLQPLFLEAARALPEYGMSMDISTKPHALPHTREMIAQCPDTLFVIDHLGKPAIRANAFDTFRRDMDALAQFPNVVAKLSGLITEADWEHWDTALIAPYIQHAVACFGEDRLLFGGDWPVVLLAGSWQSWVRTLQEVLAAYTKVAQEKIWHGNAARYYRL